MRLWELSAAARGYLLKAYWLRVAALVGLGLAVVFYRERWTARTNWQHYSPGIPAVRSQFSPSLIGLPWLEGWLLGGITWMGERVTLGMSRFDRALASQPDLDMQLLCVVAVALAASLARRVPLLNLALALTFLWGQAMMTELAAGISPALYYKFILPASLLSVATVLLAGNLLAKGFFRWRALPAPVEASSPAPRGRARLFGWNTLACTLPLFWQLGVRIATYVVPAGRPYPAEARAIEAAFIGGIVLCLLSLAGLGALRARPQGRTEPVGDALWITTHVLAISNLVILFAWLRKLEGLTSGDHLMH